MSTISTAQAKPLILEALKGMHLARDILLIIDSSSPSSSRVCIRPVLQIPASCSAWILAVRPHISPFYSAASPSVYTALAPPFSPKMEASSVDAT